MLTTSSHCPDFPNTSGQLIFEGCITSKYEAERCFSLDFAFYYFAFHVQASSPNPQRSSFKITLCSSQPMPHSPTRLQSLQLLFRMHYTREQTEQVVPGNSSAALITISVTYLTLLRFYINPTRKHMLIHRPKIHYLSALLISLSMLQSKLWTWHRKNRFSSQGAHLCYASVL